VLAPNIYVHLNSKVTKLDFGNQQTPDPGMGMMISVI
jgi:hypothetical protein